MKKLLTSTAIASMALTSISSVALSEVSMKGYVETTISSQETASTSKQDNNGTDIGHDSGVTISGAVDTDAGYKFTGRFTINSDGDGEDTQTSIEQQALQISNGDYTVTIGSDVVAGTDARIIPTVADAIEDGVKTSNGSYSQNYGSAHDNNLIAFETNMGDMGSIDIMYVPKLGKNKNGDTDATADTAVSGSATEIAFKGGLGVDGLTVLAGQTKQKNANDTGSNEGKMTTMGIAYNMGQFAVGYQQTKTDSFTSAGVLEDSDSSNKFKGYGVTYAVNDQLSLGIEYGESSGDDFTVDEEVTSWTVGYNLGGAVVSLQYMSLENNAGATGNDAEGLMLRNKISF